MIPIPSNGVDRRASAFARDGFAESPRPPVWFRRLLLLAATCAVEILAISMFADNSILRRTGGLTGLIGDWGAWTLRGSTAFIALFATFTYLKNGPALRERFARLNRQPFAWKLLGVHGVTLAVFWLLTMTLYRSGGPGSGGVFALVWLLVGLMVAVTCALAFVPAQVWAGAIRGTGWLPAYAGLASIAACVGGDQIRALWIPAMKTNFYLASNLLALIRDGVVSDPSSMLLGTQRFQVTIEPECSGFEGAGLMLAFGLMYLFFFRRECRFPHALLLIPVGIATLFALNVVRIVALILIGDAGAARIALGGFHSQAGWIAFTAVAFGVTMVARNVDWLRADGPRAESSKIDGPTLNPQVKIVENPAAPYLVPFLVILATGMLATAASAGFEWLYPLRFCAAAVTLWMFRHRFRTMDWKFGWIGVASGTIVFVLWIALDRFTGTAPAAMPLALAPAPALARFTWIAFRAMAASVTVPIAEELAFRGFLMRRLVSADFATVPFRNATLMALAASSIAFGSLHGSRWMAGAVAGAIYGFAAIRKDRIGEAVAAHAVTNAMLASYVLAFGQWQFW